MFETAAAILAELVALKRQFRSRESIQHDSAPEAAWAKLGFNHPRAAEFLTQPTLGG